MILERVPEDHYKWDEDKGEYVILGQYLSDYDLENGYLVVGFNALYYCSEEAEEEELSYEQEFYGDE